MDFAIRTPLLVLSVAIGFAMIALGAAATLPSTITPEEDRGFFLVQARGASDTTVDYLDTQVLLVEDILAPYLQNGQIETVQSIIGIGGGTSAFIVVRLPDWAERDFTQQELIAQIAGQLSSVPGVQVSARSTNSLNIRGAGGGLGFAVTGTNLANMTEAAEDLVAAMSQDATFLNSQLSNNSVDAQLEVTVDTAAASDMGLNTSDVTRLVRALVQGDVAVSVFSDDVEIDVNVVPGGPPIDDPSDIASMSIRLDSGAYIPLSAVASLQTVVSDAQIQRLGGALSVSLQANLGEGVDLSTAMDRLLEISEEVLPEGMGITFTGEAATLDDTAAGMYAVFGVALIVVLLVLAAQFESFASAVVIMMTVPFGLAAALLAISITGGSLNYYSQIGLVMLIGVMAKNGILIVEFANQLREAGEDIDSAIRNALRLRIRPGDDDDGLHGLWRLAPDPDIGRGCRSPHRRWLGDRGRTGLCDRVHPVPDADFLSLDRRLGYRPGGCRQTAADRDGGDHGRVGSDLVASGSRSRWAIRRATLNHQRRVVVVRGHGKSEDQS